MQLHVIACRVLTREISLLAAASEHTLHIHYLEQGLHDQPEVLRERLQAAIDSVHRLADEAAAKKSARDHSGDVIVLAYGLCSNAICGLDSPRFPVVVPRAHDCVTLILGSRERYQEYFDKYPGTYWYTPGWMDQTLMPGRERVEKLRERYTADYGKDNAEYLMDMEQEWLHKYNRCTYAGWPELDREEYRAATRDCAAFLEWEYDEVKADGDVLRRLLNGEWDGDDILVVPPGGSIEPSYTSSIIQPSE